MCNSEFFFNDAQNESGETGEGPGAAQEAETEAQLYQAGRRSAYRPTGVGRTCLVPDLTAAPPFPLSTSVAEQLRERVRFFKEQGRDTDFYLVPDPVWLDKRFPELGKQVKRPCVALVSTDKMWIT